jgi:hypothetical protein
MAKPLPEKLNPAWAAAVKRPHGRCSRLQPCPVSLEGLSSVARRRRSANGSATQAADDGACEGIAGRSTNQRTTTGADSTAGQRALPWGVSAGGGRQRQCGADRKICDSRHEQLLVPISRYNEEEHVQLAPMEQAKSRVSAAEC